jgi:uncharacterized protein YbbC (DUF1343 family)
MRLGIECLLETPKLLQELKGQRVALLGHPASLTSKLKPSVDALVEDGGIQLSVLFGPQHGIRGDKQDNMIESEDAIDAKLQIPVFSLYGDVRRPTTHMLDTFDILLIDLQDVGCRVYTYLTTLFYLLEDCAQAQKEVWVLDRPNPAGREIDGLLLQPGGESFVGAAPLPMRHGLTLGEAAAWYLDHKKIDLNFRCIHMEGYSTNKQGEWGWPAHLPWVNPSPNIATLNAARVYSGTVLLEGTTLSEGRGTTRPLELWGAPDLNNLNIVTQLKNNIWATGCHLRTCYFEPTFHKHVGHLCSGAQIHTDHLDYEHETFLPFRLIAGVLKLIRQSAPDYPLWRDHAYEYEQDRLPIDVINAGDVLRAWVDDTNADFGDLDRLLQQDAKSWSIKRQPFVRYPKTL